MATKMAEPKSAYPKPETEARKKARETKAQEVMEHAEKYAPGVKKMRKGGTACYARGGGIERKGKTKGRFV